MLGRFFTWCFVACILVTGCSKSNLTRSEARVIIGKDLPDFHDRAMLIYYGPQYIDLPSSESAGSSKIRAPKCDSNPLALAASWELEHVRQARKQNLDSAGIITLKMVECKGWDIEFTEKASLDVISKHPSYTDEKQYALLSLAKYRDYEITGIVQDGPQATVYIDWNYLLTPSGQALFQAGGELPDGYEKCTLHRDKNLLVCPNTHLFMRFDDGWRTTRD